MFRRTLRASSSSSSPRTPLSPSPATGPIPEDEPAPPTPIISAIQTAWNDPPSSWTSSAASAYDENPRYTTANNRTHRRKSSLITGLIAARNDPYQVAYRDWRRTPESPRGMWGIGSGGSSPKEHAGDYRERKATGMKKMRWFAGFLIVVVVVLSGVWVFGGPLPLSKIELGGLRMPFGGTFAGNLWPAGISKPDLDWRKYKPDIDLNLKIKEWDVQRFVPTKLWAGQGSGEGSEDGTPHTFATVDGRRTVTSTSTSYQVPVETGVSEDDVDKRSVVPPVVRAEHNAEESVTVVAPPVQARSESIEEAEKTVREQVATGHPSHVEEMFRKHARVITPIAVETQEEEASPPADAVPVNTAVEG